MNTSNDYSQWVMHKIHPNRTSFTSSSKSYSMEDNETLEVFTIQSTNVQHTMATLILRMSRWMEKYIIYVVLISFLLIFSVRWNITYSKLSRLFIISRMLFTNINTQKYKRSIKREYFKLSTCTRQNISLWQYCFWNRRTLKWIYEMPEGAKH